MLSRLRLCFLGCVTTGLCGHLPFVLMSSRVRDRIFYKIVGKMFQCDWHKRSGFKPPWELMRVAVSILLSEGTLCSAQAWGII